MEEHIFKLVATAEDPQPKGPIGAQAFPKVRELLEADPRVKWVFQFGGGSTSIDFVVFNDAESLQEAVDPAKAALSQALNEVGLGDWLIRASNAE